jgi:hypothetical protein
MRMPGVNNDEAGGAGMLRTHLNLSDEQELVMLQEG